MAKVTITDLDAVVDVGMGQTLLDAALAAGLDYPHSCRSGNCSACKSRLLDGDVDLMPYSEFALGPEEREAGFILACRCMVWEDSTVRIVGVDGAGDAQPVVTADARVEAVDQLTHDIVGVRLAAETGNLPTFKPGQFANLKVAGLPGRDYSMAGAPDDPVWQFHIRRVPDGATSRHMTTELAVGDMVSVKGPMGDAHLRDGHDGPILALAGGSGLAPMKSIVESALNAHPDRAVALYLGVRQERDLYLIDHFSDMAVTHPSFRFVPVLSEPAGETPYRTGFVHQAMLADIPSLAGFKCYMAGPPPMVEAASDACRARGMATGDIHADAFFSPADTADGATEELYGEAVNG